MATPGKKSYQELKNELEVILEQLQHEDTDIDKAVELHKKGQKILERLEAYLGSVEKETKSE
jgi:exodeoxyribonuclease VII small subunit